MYPLGSRILIEPRLNVIRNLWWDCVTISGSNWKYLIHKSLNQMFADVYIFLKETFCVLIQLSLYFPICQTSAGSGNAPHRWLAFANQGPLPLRIWRVSCQKGPICHASAWRVGPFWKDTIDICLTRALWVILWTFASDLIILLQLNLGIIDLAGGVWRKWNC